MTASSGVRHFFVLEASEYVERLDGLVGAAPDGGPDAEAFLRVARALRGASSMARLDALVALGAAVERVARGLRDNVLVWDDRVTSALVATVDDLRVLIRNARNWGPDDDLRAGRRTAELLGLTPEPGGPRMPAVADALTASSGSLHVVSGATEVSSALAALSARPGDHDALTDVRSRVASLRGVAAVADHPPLATLLEQLEGGLGGASVPLQPEGQAALSRVSRLLRRAADEIRAGRPLLSDAEWRDSGAEVARLSAPPAAEPAAVVPIGTLFHDDSGPHVVETADEPPTTPLARFRLESAGQAEHVRRLIAQVRVDGGEGGNGREEEDAARASSRIALALMALRDVAASYGETELARLIAGGAEAAASADPLTLDAVDALASRLLAEAGSVEELCDRLTDLARGHRLAALIGTGLAPLDATGRPTPRSFTPRHSAPRVPGPAVAPSRPTPSVATAAAPHTPTTSATGAMRPTPTGQELKTILGDSLATFARLGDGPLERPAEVEDTVVPIAMLVYDGPRALARAREIRDHLRDRGGPPPPDALDELYDLLDLAGTA